MTWIFNYFNMLEIRVQC